MAATVRGSTNAFVAEVARYLCVDSGDVERMIQESRLPAFKVPMRTRHVHRIPLRDFHAWLMARARNSPRELGSFEQFLRDFDDSARVNRKKEKS